MTSVSEELYASIRPHIAERKRKLVATQFIRVLKETDCDAVLDAELICQDAGYDPFDDGDEQ